MINESISRGSTEFAGYYEKPRTNLLDLLGSLQPRRVLEIGCGGGANLVEVKRRYPSSIVTGVELRRDVAQAARSRIDHLYEGNVLDEEAVSFRPESFDLIILSHVLE